jgi:hypothetical protein
MVGDPVSTAWQDPLSGQAEPEIEVHIGQSLAKVAAGNAWAAVAEMERLHASHPSDPVVRRYLAAFLLAAADQSRSMTAAGLLVVTSERQLAACESAGQRILDLDVAEFADDARHLVELAADGRVWAWRDRQVSVVHLMTAAALGLAVVVLGGVAQSIPLVAGGIVLGAAGIVWVVLGGRRRAWRRSAKAGPLSRRGLPD